jgi:hypothetical protein
MWEARWVGIARDTKAFSGVFPGNKELVLGESTVGLRWRVLCGNGWDCCLLHFHCQHCDVIILSIISNTKYVSNVLEGFKGVLRNMICVGSRSK